MVRLVGRSQKSFKRHLTIRMLKSNYIKAYCMTEKITSLAENGSIHR